MAKDVGTLGQITNQIDSGELWFNPVVAGAQVITYNVDGVARTDGYTGNPGLGAERLSSQEQVMATEAFELWDDLIAPSFQHAHGNADIHLAYTSDTGVSNPFSDRTLDKAGHIDHSDVFIPVSATGKDADGNKVTVNFRFADNETGLGGHKFSTMVHEIGHSLGLEHPGPYNDAPDKNISYDADAIYQNDTIQYSIMSYFNERHSGSGADYTINGVQYEPQTPMLYDVAAIQRMYGADMQTRLGDTVYGFNSSFGTTGLGSVYNFDANQNPIMTIYDAGGNDTFDVSGFSQDQVIDLTPGTFSSVGAFKQNVAMAFNIANPASVIENAVGGSGSDTIYGNDADNVLMGNGGADTLGGGKGDDTLDGGAGADSMYGGAGSDIYYVDDAGDVVSEMGVTGGFANFGDMGGIDEIRTTLGTYTLSDDASSIIEDLTFVGSGRFTGIGNEVANVLTGGEDVDFLHGQGGNDYLDGAGGDDILSGGSGNDVLVGGAGDDTMFGGLDNDTFYGVEAGDKLIEYADQGTDTVITTESYTLGDNIENLEIWSNSGTGTLVGTGNEANNIIKGVDATIFGKDLSFVLSGMAGKDTLIGNVGADKLVGGDDDDTLTGGKGADTFAFGNGWGNDTITDFSSAEHDQLDFRGSGLTSFDQLTITSEADGTRLAFSGNSILLQGVAIGDVSAKDMIFSAADAMHGRGALVGFYEDPTIDPNASYMYVPVLDPELWPSA